LVGSFNLYVAQYIKVFVRGGIHTRGSRTAIDRLNARALHQGLRLIASSSNTHFTKFVAHSAPVGSSKHNRSRACKVLKSNGEIRRDR
jgi:hypothetical protein